MKLVSSTLAIFIVVILNVKVKAQNEGEQTFNTICIACHTIGGGKLVGPDIKDVHQRHSEEWLIKFIRSSQTMIAEGDEEAIKVFNENFMIPMPDNALTDEQIKSVIAYIKIKSGGEETASTEKETETLSTTEQRTETVIQVKSEQQKEEISPASTDEVRATEDVGQSELTTSEKPSGKKETPSINVGEESSYSFKREEKVNSFSYNGFLIWLLIGVNVILSVVILVFSQSIRTLTGELIK